jgi:hypothetical protein
MMGPDDNAPTIPNRPVPPPGQGAPPPPPQTGYIEAGGRPPLWQPDQTGQSPAASSAASLNGFGLGFAIALAVLAVMVLGLIIALNYHSNQGNGGLGAVPTSTPLATPTPNVLTPTATGVPPITAGIAEGVITQFYTNISSTEYQSAYNLLSSNLQSQQSVQQFQQQWQTIQLITVDPNSFRPTPNSDGSMTLDYSYETVQNGSSQPPSSLFQATANIGYDQGNLRILALTTTQQQATPTPQPSPTSGPTPSPFPTPGPVITPQPTNMP